MKTANELEFSLLKQVVQEAEQAAHIHLAKSNCAMHMTMLGISRWSSGSTFAGWQLASAFSPLSHVSWLETANRNFLSWLEAGGFSQPEQETIVASSAESTSNQAPDATGVTLAETPGKSLRNLAGSTRRTIHLAKNDSDDIGPSAPSFLCRPTDSKPKRKQAGA